MATMKGFVLVIVLLFVILLSLFALAILSLAGSHYASSSYLLRNENARMAADNGFRSLIDRHNLVSEEPRFFFNPGSWEGEAIKPFVWMDHAVEAKAKTTWSATGSTAFEVVARRGPISSRLQMDVRQQRIERFAVYTNAEQTIPDASLVDGYVHSTAPLRLAQPEVRFLFPVQAQLMPRNFAVLQSPSFQAFDYPRIPQLFDADRLRSLAEEQGILIAGASGPLWNGERYELNLDLLELRLSGGMWEVTYSGAPLGIVRGPYFWFDRDLEIIQSWRTVPFLPSTKSAQPIYLFSAGNVFLSSGVQPIELSSTLHPVAVVASGAMFLRSSLPRVTRFNAFLAAIGSVETVTGPASVLIQDGARATTNVERDGFLQEAFYSNFIVDEPKRLALVDAAQRDERILWFRGTIVSSHAIVWPVDLNQVHFASSDALYAAFDSLPFVEIVPGSRQWL